MASSFDPREGNVHLGVGEVAPFGPATGKCYDNTFHSASFRLVYCNGKCWFDGKTSLKSNPGRVKTFSASHSCFGGIHFARIIPDRENIGRVSCFSFRKFNGFG